MLRSTPQNVYKNFKFFKKIIMFEGTPWHGKRILVSEVSTMVGGYAHILAYFTASGSKSPP